MVLRIGVGTVNSIQRYGEDIAALLIQADNLMRRGEFEQAIIQYDQAAAQNPALADIYVRRAIAKERIGRTSEARADIQHATLLNPYIVDLYGYGNNQRLLNLMAAEPANKLLGMDKSTWIYFLENQYQLDEEEARESWSISPETWEAWTEQGNALIAGSDLTGDQFLLLLDQIETITPEDIRSFLNTEPVLPPSMLKYLEANAYLKEGSLPMARETIQLGLQADPGCAPLRFFWADMDMRQGEYDHAITQYEYIRQEADQLLAILAVMNKAFVLKVTGQHNQALTELNSLAHWDVPSSWQPLIQTYRGNTFMMLGDYHAARSAYDQAIRLERTFAAAYHNRALLHILSYNWPDACADFEQSKALGYEQSAEKQKYFCGF